MALSFRDVREQLKEVTLEGVVPVGKDLGEGSYGKVFAVKHLGLVCAAKEIHSIFLDVDEAEQKNAIKDNFVRECIRCSAIRHPNIVQFLGVYFSSKHSDLPIMVMELMSTSLTSFVEKNHRSIALTTKFSILHDVSLGLSHLHGRNPPVIHRDLSSNNVLLNSHLVAKISDLGMAKLIRVDSKGAMSKLTTAPGTLYFMPPETLDTNPVYGTAVDIFSFAGIALHIFSEEWPSPTNQVKTDPITKALVAVSEAQRRQAYLDKMTGGAAVLKPLIEKCLENEPEERPLIKEVVVVIERVKNAETVDVKPSKKSVPPPIFSHPISHKESILPDQDNEQIKKTQLETQNLASQFKGAKITTPTVTTQLEMQTSTSQFKGAKVTIPQVTTQLEMQKGASQIKGAKVTIPQVDPPLVVDLKTKKRHFKWDKCADLPKRMYSASVAVDGNNVYAISGTAPEDETRGKVYCYDTTTDQWNLLSLPGHLDGILCMLGTNLSVLGGVEPVTYKTLQKVTTYNRDTNNWSEIYPNMIHGRFKPGVVVQGDHVIVMGGKGGSHEVDDSIEVMNWRLRSPWRKVPIKLPVPMWAIKPTISEEHLLIVGFQAVRSVCKKESYQLPVATILSGRGTGQWKKLLNALHFNAAIVPYSSPPVILGGSDIKGKPTSDIRLYDPSRNLWVHVGSLSSARCYVGVATINSTTIMVFGGTRFGGGVESCMAASFTKVEIGHVVRKYF
ncbi:uncharacterized protein [Dysidea avara]|uniref:uncharacterized protein isoform X2 n=1 Tax=Dysidea avara TaxID=196820 RepID=UPI0033171672